MEILNGMNAISVAFRILLAVVMGGCIGTERGRHGRAAGLRTHILVCLASALTTMMGLYTTQVMGFTNDPLRMGAQVISGIGFLGAGTIMVRNRSHVMGLTTAAGLWASAGVGLALGVGFYEAAIVAGFAVFAILTLLQRWDDKMKGNTKIIELYIELAESMPLGKLIRDLRAMSLDIESIEMEKDTQLEDNAKPLIATLRTKKRGAHSVLIERIKRLDGVIHLEEL